MTTLKVLLAFFFPFLLLSQASAAELFSDPIVVWPSDLSRVPPSVEDLLGDWETHFEERVYKMHFEALPTSLNLIKMTLLQLPDDKGMLRGSFKKVANGFKGIVYSRSGQRAPAIVFRHSRGLCLRVFLSSGKILDFPLNRRGEDPSSRWR